MYLAVSREWAVIVSCGDTELGTVLEMLTLNVASLNRDETSPTRSPSKVKLLPS